MTRDLSWTTWYGFKVLTGLAPRSLRVLKTNDNEFSLVEDSVTGRLFIRKNTERGLVQYWKDNPDDVRMFTATPNRRVIDHAA